MSKNKNARQDLESKISDHQRDKKKLIPPFLQLENIKKESWINDRLPEMLWAVLAIGNLEREEALNFFRHVAKYVQDNPNNFDITHTGISKFTESDRHEFMQHLFDWSPKTKEVLRPLLLFPDLPNRKDWSNFLEDPKESEDWNILLDGVEKTFSHQSEAATDCRWIKLFTQILGGKIKFLKTMEDSVRGVFEYPNYGDLKKIRPFIRAGEIIPPNPEEERDVNWCNNFWQYCFENTNCFPEEVANDKIKDKQQFMFDESKKIRDHYFEEGVRVKDKLVDHTLNTAQTSAVDARHECSFGIALYALNLFMEITALNATFTASSRMCLRTLAELKITINYLLKKEEKEPAIWEEYRAYGSGQAKLIYLKMKELTKKPHAIDSKSIEHIANEDEWIEFKPINLGHWDQNNLLNMSKEVGLKDIYDKYYNYTSGFLHGNWAAVRESSYQTCLSPLHRYHRIPSFIIPILPSIVTDAEKLVNSILDALEKAYPKFNERIQQIKKEDD